MLIVGLTGGIGAGKTTLSESLARRGAVVIDVDGLGRQVIGHGGSAVDAVVARFGEAVRSDDGDIDRAKLAEIVFNNEEALADLTAVSHPAINDLIDATIDTLIDADSRTGSANNDSPNNAHTDSPNNTFAGSDSEPVNKAHADESIIVLDMAVLVESSLGWENKHRYELVVVVESPLHLRYDRLKARGMSIDDIKDRIASQATDEERRQVAQFVVTNGGSIDDLNSTAGEIWAELQRLHAEKQQGRAAT